MTRQNKCDACRKAKRKCDEGLPSCSQCKNRGKTCTHSGVNKKFEFVEVTGEVIEEIESPGSKKYLPGTGTECSVDVYSEIAPTSGRKVALITTQRRHHNNQLPKKTTEPCAKKLKPIGIFHLQSETLSLLARWYSMMPAQRSENEDPIDGYGSWAIHVPSLIGKRRALDDATRCFMDSSQAIATPTDANIKAVRASNVAAVNSIRLALMESGPRACTGDILLAIQMLYYVEALLMQTHNAVMIHARGLLSLLKQHKKYLRCLDDQESAINSVIFLSNVAPGSMAALVAQRDHELDDSDWINVSLPTGRVAGISEATVKLCVSNIAYSFILIPRLTRLVRELATSVNGKEKVEKEAIELAQLLFFKKCVGGFFLEGIASGEIQYLPTMLPELVGLLPMSYRFGSTRGLVMQVAYWSVRMAICGLVDSLLLVSSSASLLFDAAAVHAEDIRTATDALMVAEQTLTTPRSEDQANLRAEKMRLVALLQAGHGAWSRFENRTQSPATGGEDELWGGYPHARRMKQCSIHVINQILEEAGFSIIPEQTLRQSSLFLAGWPLNGQLPLSGDAD